MWLNQLPRTQAILVGGLPTKARTDIDASCRNQFELNWNTAWGFWVEEDACAQACHQGTAGILDKDPSSVRNSPHKCLANFGLTMEPGILWPWSATRCVVSLRCAIHFYTVNISRGRAASIWDGLIEARLEPSILMMPWCPDAIEHSLIRGTHLAAYIWCLGPNIFGIFSILSEVLVFPHISACYLFYRTG